MQMKTELLKDFVHGVEEKGLNVRGIVVRQHGEILDSHDIVEPVERIQLYSASKTFTSMGVGIAISEGYFKITDKLVDLLSGMLPETLPQGYEKLTVWHLLTMSTGHDECPIFKAQRENMEKYQREHNGERPKPPSDGNHMADIWFDTFMNAPLTYDPDEHHFAYNNGASYILSLIVQKTTGQNLRDYLMPRVFTPLKIENPVWDCDANGHALGAIGLHLTTEELSRGGQLILNHGMWNGEQLIPKDYAIAMTQKQVENAHNPGDIEGQQGYGFQMWMCTYPGTCRFDGMFGQFSIIIPSLDAVVTITSHEQQNTYDIVRLVWDTIAPKLELK